MKNLICMISFVVALARRVDVGEVHDLLERA